MRHTIKEQAFDTELSVLSALREAQNGSEQVTQRDLASRAGVSLGMANLILRRLAERGYLELKRLSPRRVRYVLTGSGMKELARRTAGYYRRVSRSAGLYRDRLKGLVDTARTRGAQAIVLVGSSELEYLLAEACERADIIFIKTADPEKAVSLARKNGAVLVLSESFELAMIHDENIPRESLAELLAAIPAGIE